MELDLNDKSRVSDSENFEFRIADVLSLYGSIRLRMSKYPNLVMNNAEVYRSRSFDGVAG